MKREEAFALVRQHGGTPRARPHQEDRRSGGGRARLAAAGGRPAVEEPRAGKVLRRHDRQRAPFPRMGRSRARGRPGRDLPGRPAGFAQRPAARRGRAAHGVRAARLPRAALRLSRSDRGAAARRAAAIRRRALDHHPQPARDPQVAARRGALQPAALSGVVGRHSGRAHEGPHRQDRPVRACRSARAGENPDELFEQAQAAEEAERRRDRASGFIAGSCASIPATPPPRSISATCCARSAARSRPRRPIGRPPSRTLASPRPGTIWPICSMTRAAPTRRSTASSARSPPTRITPMRSSISACCTSATSAMPTRRSTGGAISRSTTTRTGRRAPGRR